MVRRCRSVPTAFWIAGIDEPGLNDPFAGAQRREFILPVKTAWSGTNINEAMGPLIDHCCGDGMADIKPDNRSNCLRLRQALQVSKRIPLVTPSPHGERPSSPASRFVYELYS